MAKTTRSFRYDLNQIPYDYTVEVRNRLKGLDLIDRMPDELWTEVRDTVQEPWESIHHYGAPLSGRKHPSVAKGLQPDAVQNPISSCGLKSTFQVRCLTPDTRTLLNDFLWYLLVFNSSFALFDQCQKRTKVMHLKMQICMASFGVGALHAPPCCCTS